MKTNRSEYSKNSGFKAPQDYFENFEERMMRRLQEQEAVKLPVKESGFSVPDGYFERLDEKILKRTVDERPRVISLFKKEYLFYAAAVAAIFILMLGNFFQTESDQPLGWDDIEISAMENYIDEGYEMGFIELNTSDYSDLILKDGKLIDDSDFYSVNSEAVFDYLDENIEDPTYILE
ncbi:hypothetical protein NE848_15355 [Gramella jeungdoensis]|uniref:DUF3379 family protein n=1 Tax=Gramella jeungdoensis TaxID=708091 RepID=A0ABT0Z4X3_9FLAO|nr:hypothetical protein [Gramella jeungdoensis]MCM8570772.1 hypothetical protein [Gramella jeungdoensis]